MPTGLPSSYATQCAFACGSVSRPLLHLVARFVGLAQERPEDRRLRVVQRQLFGELEDHLGVLGARLVHLDLRLRLLRRADAAHRRDGVAPEPERRPRLRRRRRRAARRPRDGRSSRAPTKWSASDGVHLAVDVVLHAALRGVLLVVRGCRVRREERGQEVRRREELRRHRSGSPPARAPSWAMTPRQPPCESDCSISGRQASAMTNAAGSRGSRWRSRSWRAASSAAAASRCCCAVEGGDGDAHSAADHSIGARLRHRPASLRFVWPGASKVVILSNAKDLLDRADASLRSA